MMQVSGASFETHGVSFRPFQWIESCDNTPHWDIFPFIISLQLGFQSHHHIFSMTFKDTLSTFQAFRDTISPQYSV